jgi:hypothetical protein
MVDFSVKSQSQLLYSTDTRILRTSAEAIETPAAAGAALILQM